MHQTHALCNTQRGESWVLMETSMEEEEEEEEEKEREKASKGDDEQKLEVEFMKQIKVHLYSSAN